MGIKNKLKFFKNYLQKNLPAILCFIFYLIILPKDLNALETASGKDLFENNCSGCHINGGNIIRRSKNLKISSLKRNGIDNPQSIAKIAKQGIGIMNGYEEELGKNGDQVVAIWIWEQAQNAWVQE